MPVAEATHVPETVAAVLDASADLIEQHGLCRGALARNDAGTVVSHSSVEASRAREELG